MTALARMEVLTGELGRIWGAVSGRQSAMGRSAGRPLALCLLLLAQPALQDFPLRSRERRQVDTYYDFLINEWSFKFWAVFQLVTIAILLYSTFAAIYYAKYTYLHTQPTEEDIFFRKRSLDEALSRLEDAKDKYKPTSRNK